MAVQSGRAELGVEGIKENRITHRRRKNQQMTQV